MARTLALFFLPAFVCNVANFAYGDLNRIAPAIFPAKYVLINPGSLVGGHDQSFYNNLDRAIPYSGKSKENHGEIQGRIKGGVFREKYWSKKMSGNFHKKLEGNMVTGKYTGRKDLYKGTVFGRSNGQYYAGVYKGYYKVRYFRGALKPKGIMKDVLHKISNPEYRYGSMPRMPKRRIYHVTYGHRLIPFKQKALYNSTPGVSSKEKYLFTKNYIKKLNKGGNKYKHIIMPLKQRNVYKKTPMISSKERYLAMKRLLNNLNKHNTMRLANLRKLKSRRNLSTYRNIFGKPVGMFKPQQGVGNIIYQIRSPKYRYERIPEVLRNKILDHKRYKQSKIPFKRPQINKKASGGTSKARYIAMKRFLKRIKDKRRLSNSPKRKTLKKQHLHQTMSRKRFIKRFWKKLKRSRNERKKTTHTRKNRKTGRRRKLHLYKHVPITPYRNMVKRRFMTARARSHYGGKKTTSGKIYKGRHKTHGGKVYKNILRHNHKIKLILL